MIDADGRKEGRVVPAICDVFRERVLAESILRIRSMVDESLPAFVGP